MIQNKFNQSEQEILKSLSSFMISVQKDRRKKPYKKNTSIVQIEAVFFMRLTKQKKQKLFSVSIRDINRHLNKQNKKETDFREVLSQEY